MKSSGLRTAPLSWQKALLALLAMAGLAFGGLVPHDPVSEHSGAPAGVEIDASAIHPNAPEHLEQASHVEFHPPCVGCLLQLQTASNLGRPAASLRGPDHRDALFVLSESPLSEAVSRFVPARAPPVSLASV
ncbi:MAG TPA: hypothetical protein VJ725_13825 [Thermoanaerobaculia bacterium]|nr:hypothetical protein [Thermoanaerobaculia bacterium]